MSAKTWFAKLRALGKPAFEVGKELGTETFAEWVFGGRKRAETIGEANKVHLVAALGTENKRAALLDDIRRMNDEKRSVLRRRISEARDRTIPREYGNVAKLMENDLIAILATIQSDDDGSRTDKLDWLAGVPDDEFWDYIDILWHNPVQQEIDRSVEIIIDRVSTAVEGIGAALTSLGVTSVHLREVRERRTTRSGRLKLTPFRLPSRRRS
ncbi:MAG: hypothetical protein A3C03_00925 [Candidatus Colwellbacteria bacterium RIFCSPHIGHO2_02_FULL_45_17]|uniref:Uncharacterized protein n=1 Tax=Candidatus Colwellbacteria bacterium RIFCSPLOWO2_12_FULL_46_17 TaxID=1797695 RepID=A0A1G1ZCY8_9BACT|nr:MAG: hypothetical protein A3C03_00925 [Candidatus Colwellbacteria bacterium RIFCSPHIGHO2_02_FULL_45_17]OGY62482.1 MAG: hypothetical protein A3G58_01485 [Candidatus Colwellbacteria bacterium RIFCSPLOWO2_12_FULL_46_17]